MQITPAHREPENIGVIMDRACEYPLLSAVEERDADVRKWAALRSCQRLMTADKASRDLIAELCENVQTKPPTVEDFESRAIFFQLRRDLVDILTGGEKAALVDSCAATLRAEHPPAQYFSALEGLEWPATLTVGVGVIMLRQLGFQLNDPTADALQLWLPQWRSLPARVDSKLACNLHFSVMRYLSCRDRLVVHNTRLAVKLARDNQQRSVALADLVQNGMAGLVRAAEKYDYRTGFRFTTYAYNWINQYIQRACAGNGSLIKYPAHVQQEVNHLHRVRMDYRENNGVEPGLETLAKLAQMSIKNVVRLRQLTNMTVSMDEPVFDDSEGSLEAMLPDPTSEVPVALAEQQMLNRLIGKRLAQLTELEQKIIRGRWGLDGYETLTLAQMAEQLSVSREWVRQVEKTALSKLREDPKLMQASEELAEG
ncbi:sigma-70 family RNA polymerase sigma factor [Halieaceae bacterium IMCC14734]|uniref:RNA polymerase sigma factor n=1 Tax=Candidatus Litorirhabdus singularis TaxID=2518993 RepID=A0ABT3TBD9_9GAMM|nr:RNA polymerase sigma factor RpoD/SigA [Candidatus Litorirhabdus singularis]MCX2979597.1 sigma-70 family RNA polymerase sigma factor [Candidatus Litorirhabdus singularis]